jgi:hypothetical protein
VHLKWGEGNCRRPPGQSGRGRFGATPPLVTVTTAADTGAAAEGDQREDAGAVWGAQGAGGRRRSEEERESGRGVPA